jgi:hypothetical protein
MIQSIEEIAAWTIDKLGMYSDDALSLIMRTGFAESGFRHLEQMGDGPAVGFFQVEPATIMDTWDNYVQYRPELRNALYSLGFDESEGRHRVMSNIALQVAFCRLKYRRDKYAIPKTADLEGQAKYWKRVYNTRLGKGTVEHFIKACEEYQPCVGV